MKQIYVVITVIAAFITFSMNSSAALPFKTDKTGNINHNTVSAKPIAYTLILKGKMNADGTFQPSTIMDIPRLSPEEYMPNTIHIKTKHKIDIAPEKKAFYSDLMQSSLTGLNVSKIDAPFQEFVDHTPKAANSTLDRIYELHYNSPVDVYDVCRDLLNNPEIEYAVPVFVRHPYNFTPNDPNLSTQYALTKINAAAAWDISKGDKTIKIAIVDTGTDWQHVDLADNIWTNPNEIPGDGIDNDHNGKIDDVRGWDFVGDVSATEAAAGTWKEDNDPKNPNIDQFHGTHTSGCASAVTNNGKGVASPGFSCSIIPCKCASDESVGGIFRGYEAILYAAQLGADIISCSWGGQGTSPVEQEVINQATALGSVVVVASGNNGTFLDYYPEYPASYDNVLCVGSSGQTDLPSSFSDYGNKVTVYAPGENILSTVTGNKYSSQSGTSMATPIAAGVCGLIKAIHKDYTPMQIIRQIRVTSDNVLVPGKPALRPYYYGRVNAYNALKFNNPDFPGSTVPGFYATEFSIVGSGELNTLEPTNVSLKITNYLAPADLNLTITPISNFITITDSSYQPGNFKTMETRNVDITVQLGQNNPWFHGIAELLLTYTSGTYTDYQIIRIPINITTANTYNSVYTLPIDYLPFWYGISAPDQNSMWAVGQIGSGSQLAGMFCKYTGSPLFNMITQGEALYCIEGIDGNTAYAGTGPTGGAAKIYTTTNGGANWSNVFVSSITPFVNAIHFYDPANGIFLGDPLGTKWGIGTTTDAGLTWKVVNGVPNPLATETGFVNSLCYIGDNIWFGTSAGRVFYSSDKGANWNASMLINGGRVVDVAFVNNLSGLAIYAETSAQTAPLKLARTTDGGKTWITNYLALTDNGMNSVCLYGSPQTSFFTLLLSSGEILTSIDGSKWDYVLSYEDRGKTGGFGLVYGQYVRLWSSSNQLSYIDFEFSPKEAKKILTITSNNPFDFGKVSMSISKNNSIVIKNDGNVNLIIDSIYIDAGTGSQPNEFKIMFGKPTSLSVGLSANISIKFAPAKLGLRTANLILKSDAETPEQIVQLIGTGTDSTTQAVEITKDIFSLRVSPNPAGSTTVLDYNIANDSRILIALFDLSGRLIKSFYSGYINSGQNRLEINTAGIAPGVYMLRLQSPDGEGAVKLVIKK